MFLILIFSLICFSFREEIIYGNQIPFTIPESNKTKNLIFFKYNSNSLKILLDQSVQYLIHASKGIIGFNIDHKKATITQFDKQEKRNSNFSYYFLEFDENNLLCDKLIVTSKETLNISISFSNISTYSINPKDSICFLYIDKNDEKFKLSSSISNNNLNPRLHKLNSTDDYSISSQTDDLQMANSFLLSLSTDDFDNDDFMWNITVNRSIQSNRYEFWYTKGFQAMYNLHLLVEGPIYLKNSTIIVEKFFDAIVSKQLVIIYTIIFLVIICVILYVVMQNSCTTKQMSDEKALIRNDREEESSDSEYDQPYPSTIKYVPQNYLLQITRIGNQRIVSPQNSSTNSSIVIRKY